MELNFITGLYSPFAAAHTYHIGSMLLEHQWWIVKVLPIS
jgi:hypothetical protein